MSLEPSLEGHATPVALGSASSPLSRLVEASRTIAGESESRPMLRLACRELTQILEAALDAREHGLKATILAEACATIDAELEATALRYARDVGGIRLG